MSDGASGQRLGFADNSCLSPGDGRQEWLRDERLEQETSREEHGVIVIESSSSMDSGTADAIADGVSRQLDPRWIMVQRVHFAILLVILATVSFAGVLVIWAASGILVLGLLLVPLWLTALGALGWLLQRWPAISYRHTSYRVDEAGLEITRGVYWRTTTNVPRSRIQHTDVSQGPLERRYSLGSLVVYTAGTHHSEVTLSGLEFTIAQRIRAHLLPRDQGDAV
jgi:membrane protein YdbS with pleckstrin-like domain